MFSLWTASSFTSRNIASAPLALALMPIHYWVAIRASQEIRPKIGLDFYPSHGLTGYRNLPQLESTDSNLNTFLLFSSNHPHPQSPTINTPLTKLPLPLFPTPFLFY